ncbi:MAG: iron-containing alcohol dehydrogenase [Lentisphaeraceae bacterium]|nr:iron-containing alcohol dehydrogenase [Lentisphaeraceae bacterium]
MDILTEFQTVTKPQLIYGAGSLLKLPEVLEKLKVKKAFIVTDKGISQVGYPTKVKTLLEEKGFECFIYDGSCENPTETDAENCAVAARSFEPDVILGLGGGSSMDTAKACNFLYTNGGRMEDYHGYGKATKPMLPLICIPTTSGTGSECQSFALISRDSDHKKMACGDPKNAAEVAILDPELTLSQPKAVTANTGIDALAHAIETYVSLKATPYSRIYSAESFRLLAMGLPKVLREPDDIVARSAMLLGAAYAGIAIEHSMLGAAHGCANPITARFSMTHGQAVGLMLPPVIRRNSEDPVIHEDYQSLLLSVSGDEDCQFDSLDQLVENHLELANLPLRLSEVGISEDKVSELAEDAETQWTSSFNPVMLGERDFLDIYSRILE